MFNSLLGRKFSAKCKHAIKDIGRRIPLIRKRRQSTLNFLMKGVADLLLGGHESVAYGRMDQLLAEMNLISCYDMIEKFCECIQKELSCLQKQRECPLELMEAVSSIIFAAARFSDLPELCDLRYEFITRYGSAMEASVNPVFADKLASTSFSMARKLQSMRDIAQELSVSWNSEALEYRMSNPTEPASDKSKKVGSLNNHKNDGRQDTAINGGKQEISSHGIQETPVMATVWRQVEAEAKDIHVISSSNNGHPPKPTEKTKQILADEPVTLKRSNAEVATPRIRQRGTRNETPTDDQSDIGVPYNRSTKAGEGLHFIYQEREAMRQLKSSTDGSAIDKDIPHVKVKMDKNGTEMEDRWKKDAAHGRSSGDQEGLDPVFQEKVVIGLRRSGDDNRMVPPYIRPRGKKDATNDENLQKYDVATKASSRAPEDVDFIRHERQAVEQLKSSDGHRVSNLVPPYSIPIEHRDGKHTEDQYKNGVTYSKSSRTQQALDPTVQEKQVTGSLKPQYDRAINMIPPYVKPKVSKMGPQLEHSKPSDHSIHENVNPECCFAADDNRDKDSSMDELVVDDGKPKPRSVRRKHPKPLPIQKIYISLDGDEPAEPVAQIQSGLRRHSTRRDTPTIEDDYDEEEKNMDRLLMHYSKRGMADQSSKPRMRIRVPPMDHANETREAEPHQTNGRPHSNKVESHPPKRATSLPQDPISPSKEKVKGPARVTSMQPDLLSPQGGLIHPRLPDYDDLAARFIALKQR